MTMLNVVSSGVRQQVLMDEGQLAKLQAELTRRGVELERLKTAMETLSAVNTPAQFMAAAMGLCNELASRWRCERVGIGFLKGRYVRLQALSHTERITRHMQLVQDIEAAMEESLDQDLEILFPPTKDAGFIYRATERLSTRQGPNAVCSIPLRRSGEVVAVLTLERKLEQPFTADEVETLRLTVDLLTARLFDLYEHSRFIAVKAGKASTKALAWAVGAKHTWPKVISAGVIGLLAFSIFVHGDHKIESSFVVQASEMQIVSSPFDGFIKTVNATVGDMVWTEKTGQPFDDLIAQSPLVPLVAFHRPPTVMATMDTAELRNELASSKAERMAQLQQANIDRREGINKQGAVEIDLAMADKAQASIDLYSWRIDHATIKTPVDGFIFQGDLKQQLGAPTKLGDQLFQVGDRKDLRAELSIPEDQIADVRAGQRGDLAASSYPGVHIPFFVERVNPVATVVEQHNVFKVRAAFSKSDITPWLKPGMEGLAKVTVGREPYIWIWTHRLVEWVRLKLWM